MNELLIPISFNKNEFILLIRRLLELNYVGASQFFKEITQMAYPDISFSNLP